ncbi:inositol 1,4,5-triphosphate receptor associated 2 isoform X3 [Dunckerocampus dactyliophorus]|uniref:inositol 1,4,5-triphosphate receptor associated 2 isoform X3 n=1 Tax=Dunckerocampus dactyliophorus TaxID=161453 RepID=UPI0024075EC8|nr:inositol 1,4,5-triphosphate receptor associated 2 isoform X3 [Dunckerocampus dactyliophorus]
MHVSWTVRLQIFQSSSLRLQLGSLALTSMDFYMAQPARRHNPVDSICRKLQTIQWRGEREPYSAFQIPKLSSSSYDSPRCGLRHNLEAILKKGTRRKDECERRKEEGMPSSGPPQKSTMGPSIPPSAFSTPACNPPTPANITYTITSTFGERRSADDSDVKPFKTWQRYCSTPTGQSKDSTYLRLTHGEPQSAPSSKSPPLSRTFTPSHSTVSYNLNFSSADTGNSTEFELPYAALVVKRLSLEDGGNTPVSDSKNMAEISLICEENLLDTIFHACDTQRRGKVYVSHIVDYLRHTTSRSSEDSGLEELCNMLDPERKDVSIDLDTYHAVMREWIEDCRSNRDEPEEVVTQDSIKLKDSLSAKRSMLLNMTSGSLEGFGGDASRAEFETSELVYCVADLQMSNQKLQEEVKKLKQVVEGMEDSNQKLADENVELRNQARGHQQLVNKEKMLKEEVEEMKATLSCTEEDRARASAHSKHVEKENQGLIANIASLQEENFKVTMEMDELQKRIAELCDINADLQVQIHSFDAVICEKEARMQEKSRQVDELKAAVEEYSSITELLRADKSKLENQMQMIHPDLAGAGVSLSVAYRLNQSPSGSLQTELALAQSPLELIHGVDHLSTSVSFASPLDETLDREVLLMMNGPSPEHMALEFKKLLSRLKTNFRKDTRTVLSSLKALLDEHLQPGGDTDASLEAVQAELDARREDWALSLDQLAQYTDSIEKELIKMASNMRRSRTEILHLSVRVQEQENQKRQLCEELDQLKTTQDSREASCQTPAPEEEPGEDLEWDEEYALQDFLKSEIPASNCRAQGEPKQSKADETVGKVAEQGEEDDGEEKWMVVDRTGEGEVRDTSTPVSAVQSPLDASQEDSACTQSEPEVKHHCLQDEAAPPSDAHSQAVSPKHLEADALPDPSHSENRNAETHETALSQSEDSAQNVSTSPDQDPALPPGNSSHTPQSASIQLTGEEHKGEEKEDMSCAKSLILDQSTPRSAAEDITSLLPVVVEEEESVQESNTAAPTEVVSMAGLPQGTEQPTRVGGTTLTDTGCQQPSLTQTSQSESSVASKTSDQLESKKDSLAHDGKNKKQPELSHGMDTTEAQKVGENKRETPATSEKESEASTISDHGDACRADNNSLSPNDKEIETEFQRLALGFKCDMFTLEKRLRLEERSRDLAEENVRREVSSCQGLLQALIPLCEDDNQSMEIIHRLQKNLDILIQSMTRVSSRAEMLGAIHQESRIGKAVEVMIQHVENLRRVYTKEHAELLELRETLMQNERSFGSHTERDEFRGKKPSTSQYYKSSTRRVSIAAIPRSGGINMHYDVSKQDGSDMEAERLTRRSPWNVAGKNMARPPLKRFVSSAAWVDTEEPSVMMKGTTRNNSDAHSADEPQEPVAERRRSSLSELGSKLTSLILPLKTPSCSSSPASSDPGLSQSLSHTLTSSRVASAAAVARGSRGLWLWLAMVLVLAGLLALLASLVMQPAVDAAPVGTGDSWMTIQQLLWPYTGLRHNGQPPV